jgi:membrane protease YdiL (CAAX protease family)
VIPDEFGRITISGVPVAEFKEDIMTTIKAFIKRHPLLTYFALTFALSWGGVLLVIGGPGGIPGTQEEYETLLPPVGLALLAGPSVAGILLTGLSDGRAGFREFRSRLLTWRVGARWYAVALLTAPPLFLSALLALSLVSPVFRPGIFASDDPASILLMGIVAGLVVGFFEELGWTGFATPRLRLRYGVFTTGLILGVLWGAWHVLTNDFWAAGTSLGAGELSLPLFLTARGLLLLVGQMPAYRVLTVWAYDRTGSLLVAMLMHMSLTASTLIFQPPAISGAALLIYCLALDAATWVVVGAVAVASRGQLSQQPLRRRVA